MRLKHFAILERQSDGNPMIAVIDRVTNNPTGLELFQIRLETALKEHFDTEEIELRSLPDIFEGMSNSVIANIEGGVYEFQIIETWIY